MKRPQEALLAYISTLVAIVLLTLAAAIMVETADLETERGIAKLIGALGFIASAVSGLIGVIGTFRPKGQHEGSE